jgi:hypothetical protein
MKLVLVGVLAAISMGGIYLWSASQTKIVPISSPRALDTMIATSSRSGSDPVSNQVVTAAVDSPKSGVPDNSGGTSINEAEASLTVGTCPDLRSIATQYEEYPVLVKKAFGIENAKEGVADSDGDCLLDSFEIERCYKTCDPAVALSVSGISEFLMDYDNDGLTTGEEQRYGTFPGSGDTDVDALSDQEEIQRGTDPLVQDSDKDGIDDGLEIQFSLNPLRPDADTVGVYPATWKLADDLEVSLYVSGTAGEVVKFKNSYGNSWDPHNYVFWRNYTLSAIDYSRYFNSPIKLEKVVIKNPSGKVFYPVYFLSENSPEVLDFADLVMARSSSIDAVESGANIHLIGSLIRALAFTDDLAQFTAEEEVRAASGNRD